MSDSQQVIQWKEGRFGTVGYVGQVRLFSYGWGTVRNDPEPWKLTTDLPGWSRKKWSGVTREDCQAKAEELLRKFAAYLGANGVKFPGQVDEAA
jgi:hypothetical protein